MGQITENNNKLDERYTQVFGQLEKEPEMVRRENFQPFSMFEKADYETREFSNLDEYKL